MENIKKFRMDAHAFFLTYPRCHAEKEELWAALNQKGTVTEYIVSRELHADGTPHLHAYVKYEKRRNVTNPAYFDFNGYHGDYQVCKNKHAVIKYVDKHGDSIKNFDPVIKEECRLKKKRDISRELMSGRPLSQVTEDNPELLFGYKKLKEDLNSYLMDKKVAYSGKRENLWLYGQPGCGKSQYVYRTYPNAYRKDQSKWWDSYQGEEEVVLEDLDTNALGHHLKIWADNYACNGEVKGAKVPLMHKTFIVTSNYLPSELWKDDLNMVRAVQRRFKFYTTQGDYDNGYSLKNISIQ